MNEDERLNRLINFNFFGFQNTDLKEILCTKDLPETSFHHLTSYRDCASVPVQACFLGFLSCLDSTFIMYAYQFKKTEYAFAWESFYDECHRASNLNDDPPWFEFIEQGQYFRIRLNPQNPCEHFITERPFLCMNDTVIELGTSRCQ